MEIISISTKLHGNSPKSNGWIMHIKLMVWEIQYNSMISDFESEAPRKLMNSSQKYSVLRYLFMV